MQDLLRAMPFLLELQDGASVSATAALLMCLVFVGSIVLYLLGSIARGGLIAGVDAVERGEKRSLCFLLWPLIWLFEGFIALFFLPVWTLARRQWTTDAVKVQVSA